MVDLTYLVKLKMPGQGVKQVVAATVELHGEQLAFLDSKGRLAALFPMETVQSWTVVPH